MQNEAAHHIQSATARNDVKTVVIVDDSRTIRSWLRVVLEEDPRLKVIGEADSANTARQVIKEINPDVLTLDIEMPGMNGIDFLEKLMRLRPMPVVMISGATRSNSEATIRALTLGAVDCILKPSTPHDEAARRNIVRRVYSAASSQVQLLEQRKAVRPVLRQRSVSHKMPLILIGASTGGVNALGRVLADLEPDGPPVVIVQHMPGTFLDSFSAQLNRNLPQNVQIAREGEQLGAGDIRIAPAEGQHTQIARHGIGWTCRFVPDTEQALHCPSVDTLFTSGQTYSKDIIGVILTGLGRDGADGLALLHDGGAQTVGQDETTSVVYGMPRAAFELGAVDQQLAINKIGDAINQAVQAHAKQSAIRRVPL